MVRGPSALLAAALGALAYLLLVPALPDLGNGDVSVLVSGAVALVALGALALSLVGLYDAWALAALLGAGGAMIAAAMTVAGAGAAADVPKAIFAAAVGTLLAQLLAAPAVLVAVPLFVAAVNTWSVVSGPASPPGEQEAGSVDFLTLVLPAWGGGEVERLGLSDLLFLAFFAALAWRYGLRRAVTGAALVGALVAALVAEVVSDTALPVLPFLAAALLVPNLDRVARVLRAGSEG